MMLSKLLMVLLMAAIGVAGCAAPPAPPGEPGAAPPGQPKRVVWAMNQPVEGFTELFGGPASAWRAPYHAVHDFLAALNDVGDPVPRLATEIPSQATGSWKVNPDGTMDTTWKLRPGITWHNGEPLRPADFELGWRVALDPSVPWNKRSVAAAIGSIEGPDTTTLIFHWKNLYPFADRIQPFDLDALPSWNQSLRDIFETNKADFANHPWFSREFVGLGPYRVTAWEPGINFVLEPFGAWYGGRAKIDRIEVRLVLDDQVRLAGVLSGDIDLVLANAGGLGGENANVLRKQWEAAGKGAVLKNGVGRLTYSTPKWANPLVGGKDKARVRQAMTHALDKDALATLNPDPDPVSHSWIQEGTPLWSSQKAKIMKYEYELTRAAQLFREAGWMSGPDGLLRNAGGERFAFECWCSGVGGEAVVDMWKKAGMEVEQVVTPPQLSANLEYQASFPGVQSTGNAISFAFLDGRFHSRNIARPENRWGGQNRAAYSDPEADSLVERILRTLAQNERWSLEGDLANLVTRDAVVFWLVHPTPSSQVRKGVTGLKAIKATGQSGDIHLTWNVAEWDLI